MADDTSHLLKREDGDVYHLQCFKRIFLRYYESLCIYSYRYTKNTSVSEDIVQDVFAELWEKRNEIDYQDKVKSLFYKCVHDNTVNYLKSADCTRIDLLNHYEENVELEDFVEDAVGGEQESLLDYQLLLSQVQSCVENLPEQCRKIFKMSRDLNLSNKAIAEQLGISVKAVEKQITKALSEIRIHISKEGFFTLLFYYLINRH